MTDTADIDPNDHPNVVEPPPFILAVVLAVLLGIDGLIQGPGFGLSSEARLLVGLLFAIIGMTLIIVAGAKFRAAKTYIEPWKPTTTLITDGLYAWTRNPIYLGMALGYIGICFLGDSVVALAGLPIPVAIVHYGVILREERYLESKFGQTYRDYMQRVRRWL
jgi:protein-S-isoprenylcysteine O-methyltransferase Ste14